jgi:hypothetical protein
MHKLRIWTWRGAFTATTRTTKILKMLENKGSLVDSSFSHAEESGSPDVD